MISLIHYHLSVFVIHIQRSSTNWLWHVWPILGFTPISLNIPTVLCKKFNTSLYKKDLDSTPRICRDVYHVKTRYLAKNYKHDQNQNCSEDTHKSEAES